MREPVEFVAGNRNEGTKMSDHIYYMVKAHDKYLALKRVADNSPISTASSSAALKRDAGDS